MDRFVVVIFGLMGVGKTTVARALAKDWDWPVVHSDLVRKALAGLDPTTPARFPFGQGIYREDFSRQTYEEMRRQAREHIEAGAPGVILDASFKSARERAKVRELAAELGARAVFVYCTCPKEVVRSRLTRRLGNATAVSDGRPELLDLQEEDFEPLTEADRPFFQLDTSKEVAEVIKEVEAFFDSLLEKK